MLDFDEIYNGISDKDNDSNEDNNNSMQGVISMSVNNENYNKRVKQCKYGRGLDYTKDKTPKRSLACMQVDKHLPLDGEDMLAYCEKLDQEYFEGLEKKNNAKKKC